MSEWVGEWVILSVSYSVCLWTVYRPRFFVEVQIFNIYLRGILIKSFNKIWLICIFKMAVKMAELCLKQHILQSTVCSSEISDIFHYFSTNKPRVAKLLYTKMIRAFISLNFQDFSIWPWDDFDMTLRSNLYVIEI